MKRVLSAIFVMLLLLGLCACDLDVQDEQSGQDAQAGPDYALLIRLTVKSEVTLYLDSQQKVLRTKGADADAESLLAQLNVSGKPYTEAVAALLGSAYDRGELKEGSQVQLDIGIADCDSFAFDAVCAPVAQFEQDKGIKTDVALSFLEEEVPENATTAVIDGKKVYISQIPHMSEGSRTGLSTIYSWKKPSIFTMDPTEYAVKTVYRGEDGSSNVYYYEDGVLTCLFAIEEDGATKETDYYSNGNQKSSVTKYPDGDYMKVTNYENGELNTTENQSNGSYIYQEYSENGKIRHQKYRAADGSYSESTYDSNGRVIQSKTIYTSGETLECVYNSNGDYLEYKNCQPNGDYYIAISYESGKRKSEETMRNGDYDTREYAENGVMTRYEYRYADGTHGLETYSSNGNSTKAERYEADGDYWIHTFHENGKINTAEGTVAGTYFKTIQEEDGSFQYAYYAANGGEECFFSGGKVVKAIIRGVTYTDPETLSAIAAGYGINQ